MSEDGQASLPNLWRKNSYPVQHFNHGPADPSRWSSVTAEDAPLPKAMRAVQDNNLPCQGRTLIICLDGTGDSFDNDNSNVINFIACLKKDDPSQLS